MITPGPMVITTGFAGYLMAGHFSAVLSDYGVGRAAFQEARQTAGAGRFRKRHHRGGHRRDRQLVGGAGAAFADRFAHRIAGDCGRGFVMEAEEAA
nr:hypothetical protein [Chromobacterium vaccinii]